MDINSDRIERIINQTFTFTMNRKFFEKNGFIIASVKVKDCSEDIKSLLHAIYKSITVKGRFICPRNSVTYEGTVIDVEYNEKYRNYSLTISNVYPYGFTSNDIITDKKMVEFLHWFVSPSVSEKVKNVKGICKMIQEEDSESLLKINGLGVKTIKKIYESYRENVEDASKKIKLKRYGFSINEIDKLSNLFNDDLAYACSLIDVNPFELVLSYSFRLDRIDSMFLANGGNKTDRNRIKCYIVKNLKDKLYENYKSYITLDEFLLLPVVNNIIMNTGEDLFNTCIKELVEQEKIKVIDNKIITLYSEWKLETKLVDLLNELSTYTPKQLPIKDIDKEIDEQEIMARFKLNSGQRSAVKSMLTSDKTLQLLTGSAGCGKTTVIRFFLNIVRKYTKDNFLLCALSGKASAVLGNASGYKEDSATIHRTLGGFGENAYNINNKFEDVSVLVIDEISMLDFNLLYNILSPIKNGMKCILIGDENQLPSLFFGSTIRTLKLFDINDVKLTQVMRQSEDSQILYIANRIKDNVNVFKNEKYVTYGNDVECCIGDSFEYLIESYIKDYKEDPTKPVIVTTTKAKVDKINFEIQDRLIKEGIIKTNGTEIIKPSNTKDKKYKIYKGNYIMVLKNDYNCRLFNGMNEKHIEMMETMREYKSQHLELDTDDLTKEQLKIYNDVKEYMPLEAVFNGEVYKIIEIYPKYNKFVLSDGENEILADYISLQFQLPMACVCHKVQGSTYDNAYVYFDSSYVDTNIMLNSNWLYTATTRSKHKLSIHTDKYNNISKAIRKNAIDEKLTLIEYLHDNGKLVNNK